MIVYRKKKKKKKKKKGPSILYYIKDKCKRPDRLSNQFDIIWYAFWFLPGQHFHDNWAFFASKKAHLVEQRIQLFFVCFFRWLLPCQYFLGKWTLLSFSLFGVYIDQSSSSQIHPKCNLRQDSPNMWNEVRFTKNVKWAKIETSTNKLQFLKRAFHGELGLGMRESLILCTHLARESISGIRKARDTRGKVPDWQAANFNFENVSSNRGIFEKKNRDRFEREEENKLPTHSLM